MVYNSAFFNGLTAVVKVLKERYGEDEAIEVMRDVFTLRLKGVYDSLGFQKGDPDTFVKVVRANDTMIGLEVEFPEVSDTRIVYRFLRDPFPSLRGVVDPVKFDDSYLRFKIEYILGEGWDYTTTKHFWKGDGFTEHVIERK